MCISLLALCMGVPGVYIGHVSVPLELELHMAVSNSVGAGNTRWIL